jgi:uncharacterized protein (TIGR02646 family)
MRYIDKSKPCVEFEVFLKNFGQRLHGKWEYVNDITQKDKNGVRIKIGQNTLLLLFQHLRREQKCLCVYCEQNIPEKTEENRSVYKYAHFEHVKKQAVYKDAIFQQSNLAISCNGFDNMEPSETLKKDFCGHFKDGNYNPLDFQMDLFLNPLIVKEISAYFAYEFCGVNKDEIEIIPATTVSDDIHRQAKHTIDVLGLNHQKLREMRYRKYIILIEDVLVEKSLQDSLTYDELPDFYSMLSFMGLV